MAETEARVGVWYWARAAGETDEISSIATNDTKTVGAETDEGKEDTDTGTGAQLDAVWQQTSEPLSDTEEREEEEDPTLEPDSRESLAVGDDTASGDTDNGESKVGVDTETRSETEACWQREP